MTEPIATGSAAALRERTRVGPAPRRRPPSTARSRGRATWTAGAERPEHLRRPRRPRPAQVHATGSATQLERHRARPAARASRSRSRTTSPRSHLPTTCGSRILEGYVQPVRGHRGAPAARGGRGHRRQDEHGRVRDGLVHREQRVRPDAQSARARPRPRRLVGRLGGRGRRGHRAHRARLGDRRLGAPAGRLLRRRRRQADVRAREPLRARRLRVVARPDRRLRRAPWTTPRSGSEAIAGHDPLDSTSADVPVPDYRDARARPARRGS